MSTAIENASILAIIAGGLTFGLFIVLLYIEQKFPKIEDSKFTKTLKNFFTIVILLCIPISVISIFLEWITQPSGFEKCMEGVNSGWDDNAIAWMEDYCYSNR